MAVRNQATKLQYTEGSAVRKTAAVPKQNNRPKPTMVPLNRQLEIQKRQRERQKEKTHRSVIVRAVFCGIAVVVFSVLTTYSKGNLAESVSQIGAAEKTLEQLKSDNTRLENVVEQRISYQNVEKYAMETLGMVKITGQQTHYIKTYTGDKIEKTAKDEELSLQDKIATFFGFGGSKTTAAESDEELEESIVSTAGSSATEESSAAESEMETENF